jgi:hypothetical protein
MSEPEQKKTEEELRQQELAQVKEVLKKLNIPTSTAGVVNNTRSAQIPASQTAKRDNPKRIIQNEHVPTIDELMRRKQK